MLVIRGGGARVLRLNIPRWIVYGALGVVLLKVSALAAVWGDYLFLKQQWGQIDAVRRHAAEQRDLIDSLQKRVADVRGEITTWKELHAKMWEPFGPETGAPRKRSGIGGGAVQETAARAGNRPALVHELDLLAASVSEESPRVRALERVISKTGKVMAALPSRWPVRGGVNSEFGRRHSPWTGVPEFHSGIDIAAERATPIKAPGPGAVVAAGPNGEYGNQVVLDHGSGIQSRYGHLLKILVASGQRVERGQVIALSGNTGRSSGPHLHYEVIVRGQAVNPRGFLWDQQ